MVIATLPHMRHFRVSESVKLASMTGEVSIDTHVVDVIHEASKRKLVLRLNIKQSLSISRKGLATGETRDWQLERRIEPGLVLLF